MQLRHIQQISDQHCGPAVLQMLLAGLGLHFSQEEITHYTGAEQTLAEHGTRIDQLATACKHLAPQTQFWFKYYSTLDDIRTVLQRGYGVGVEWQGLFYDSEEEEEEDGEYGHYSIISYLDEQRQAIIIVDPYKAFANQDRIFDVSMFLRRWWDTNEVASLHTGHRKVIRDERPLFFVTPLNESFPHELGFQRA